MISIAINPLIVKSSITKTFANIKLGLGRTVPKSAKALALAVNNEQLKIFTERRGTKNKTGRASGPSKYAIAFEISPVNLSPKFSRVDIIQKAPHAMWVEKGSNAEVGLPWTNPKSGKPRDFAKSAFTGYQPLDEGVKSVLEKKVHIKIFGEILRGELTKLKVR